MSEELYYKDDYKLHMFSLEFDYFQEQLEIIRKKTLQYLYRKRFKKYRCNQTWSVLN